MLCLHLGPGRLGLGLIVDQLDEVRFSVCLVGSPDSDSKEQTQFGLSFIDPDTGLEYRDVEWASNADTVEDLPPDVLELVDGPEPLLLTCALGEGIAARADWLVELVRRRPDGAETVLLACENDLHEAYEQLIRRAGDALKTYPCVVDRICAWPSKTAIDDRGHRALISHPRDDQDRRVVSVHPIGEWIISVADDVPATLSKLSEASLVTVTHLDNAGFKARKLWSVNGVHMVLALIARREGVDILPLEGAYEQAFLTLAGPLMRQISAGVAGLWPEIPVEEEYASARIAAFVESPDETARILERHLVRTDLRPFMRRLDRRLGEAARAAQAAGQDCEPFYQAMALVVAVLSDLTRYYADDGQPLDRTVDEQVIDLFARVLERWLDGERASDLLATLRRALRGHHSVGSSPGE
ncbi:MAG TPA: hypothetical protein VG053_01360 [Solirubrobacteraceae bacterium]|jgi:mannitol-1-phosphate/altronate dehydrogenase|nr:hypothetical protein [Solirubrobacteraceae bacterium]